MAVMPVLALLDIGPFELLLLAAAAVMLFGGDLPDVARKAARMVARLRSLSADLSQELTRPPPELRRPPELDRPKELDLTQAERDLLAPPDLQGNAPASTPGPTPDNGPSGAAGTIPTSVPAPVAWRPRLSPPDPEHFPGAEPAPISRPRPSSQDHDEAEPAGESRSPAE